MVKTGGSSDSVHEDRKKVKGRSLVPENADANKAIGRPKALDQVDQDLLEQVLAKYDVDNFIPIIEALIAEGKPVKGLSKKLDPDYFIQKFVQIGHTASKPFDRILALEKAAKLCGHFEGQKTAIQGVNIKFDMTKPADAEVIDAEFGTIQQKRDDLPT